MHNRMRQKLSIVSVMFALVTMFTLSQVQSLLTIPAEQHITVGDEIALEVNLPRLALEKLSINIEAEKDGVIALNGVTVNRHIYNWFTESPVAMAPGKLHLQLKLFGLIPVKNMELDVIPRIKLVPGGHSIGVLLSSQGVMVVGYSPLVLENGEKVYPAKEAGINIGDLIVKVNGHQIENDQQIAKLVQAAGKSHHNLNFTVKRNGKEKSLILHPKYCNRSGTYRIGLYIRDGACGVGTLTFYDPKTKNYGALGHIIVDADTGQPIDVAKGKILTAPINGIQKGRKGSPGEKIGIFTDDGVLSGNITENSNVGIFGIMNKPITNPFHEPLPVATVDQIKIGKAHIITVIENEKLEKFEIEITRILPFERVDGKKFIVQVTDKRLLDKTGGIIQGMSGSPIIQHGRIIGAVTHVFVNDPSKGYGVPIEKMLIEAGILNSLIEKEQKAS